MIKADLPIELTVLGMVMVVKSVNPKVLSSILSSWISDSKVKFTNFKQSKKTLLPIVVTEAGIVKLEIDV